MIPMRANIGGPSCSTTSNSACTSTGKELWSFHAGAGVNAPPSTYMVGGKQYIVVGAGGNTQVDFHRGNNIIAFTLN
jgi:alcohol dehydrogenase (cytochrome c)